MIVTLKDGSKKEYAEAKSVIDIAYDISEGLARAACAGEVNGEVVDRRVIAIRSFLYRCWRLSVGTVFIRNIIIVPTVVSSR